MWDTLGYNLVDLMSGIDAHALDPHHADTIFCDIGEADPSFDVQSERTKRVLGLLERWLEHNPGADFVCKVLQPGSAVVLRKLETMQQKYGGSMTRSSGSRNSTLEMYYVSGMTTNIVGAVKRNIVYLNSLFSRDLPQLSDIPGPTLPKGTRSAPFTGRDMYLRNYNMISNITLFACITPPVSVGLVAAGLQIPVITLTDSLCAVGVLTGGWYIRGACFLQLLWNHFCPATFSFRGVQKMKDFVDSIARQ